VPQSTTPTTDRLIDELREKLSGEVIGPDDDAYEAARIVLYGRDARPLAIAKVADTADVVQVVTLARERGLDLAVRSGGHSSAGHGTADGGLVLDLANLHAIDVDVASRTVWAGSGLTAGALSTALAEHDLAIGFGDTGSVGIGGITLGGGIGYLVRKYGLTIDNLVGAEIVTADGAVREVDGQHDPDLFWAIRGGGGNFGVVTRFRFELRELPQVVGGMLFLPATAATIAGFIAASEAAPEELSTICNIMPAPPMPMIPEAFHGQPVIMGMLAYAGDTEAGEQALAPFRALAAPIADFLKPMPYPGMFPPEEGGGDIHPSAVARNMFIDHVDETVAQTILDQITAHMAATDAMAAVAQLRVLGGAMARVPVDATAFAHRSSPIMATVAALFGSPDDTPKHLAFVEGFAAALDQGQPGAYVNFVADEGPERVHAAYPGRTWDRLAAIKERYDPGNVFHLNQNVPPSAGTAAS
jgi:FAD/FMN-containing dehydrogenase